LPYQELAPELNIQPLAAIAGGPGQEAIGRGAEPKSERGRFKVGQPERSFGAAARG
jgi:hypothetical protein